MSEINYNIIMTGVAIGIIQIGGAVIPSLTLKLLKAKNVNVYDNTPRGLLYFAIPITLGIAVVTAIIIGMACLLRTFVEVSK